MKIEASVLTVLIFIGAGAGTGLVARSGVVHVPVLTDMARASRVESNTTHTWPPVANEPYPDLELTDLNGQPVRLSDYRGRVLLIEPIAMSCKACQSFSGANEIADTPETLADTAAPPRGPYGANRGGAAQLGLESFETYLQRFANVTFDDPRVLYVQVLIYDLESNQAPTLEDARAWANHFGLVNRPNVMVTVASERYQSRETRSMIPGFHLVDQNGLLRGEAGKPPRQDLYREFLPSVGRLLRPDSSMPAQPSEPASAIEPATSSDEKRTPDNGPNGNAPHANGV